MHRAATASRGHAAVIAAVAVALAFVMSGCAAGEPATATSPAGASPSAFASPSASPAPSASPTGRVTPGVSPSPSLEASDMATPASSSSAARLTLVSPAFADGAPIPPEYSCRGADVSPALAWTGVPAGTGGLVLFVDDPDGRDWVHWSVLDLPPIDGGLPRDVAPTTEPPQQGRNDFGKVGYGGPCPPSGTHHYRFTLYALAAPLGLAGHPDGKTVRAALGRASVLGRVTLVGTFRH